MSQIKQDIQARIKEAMKAREQEKLLTLRGLAAAIKQVEVDTREELDDGKVKAILQKELKKRREALSFAQQQQRSDLIAQNEREITWIEEFLGAQLSETELRNKIQQLISSGVNNIGGIMGALNKENQGQFDGKLASTIAKELLG